MLKAGRESIVPVIFSNSFILAVVVALQWAGFPEWVNMGLYFVAMWVGVATVKLVWYWWKRER
jgi:hypothetical protein